MPFRLPRSSVTLMVVHETLGKKRGICPHNASQRSKMLSCLGISLMRHRDAANPRRQMRLAQLANLIALEVIDLVANAIGGAGQEHEEMRPFRQNVAARGPR